MLGLGQTESVQGTANSKLMPQTMRLQIASLPRIQSKKMQQIKSILIGWVETNDLARSFIKFLGVDPLIILTLCQDYTLQVQTQTCGKNITIF